MQTLHLQRDTPKIVLALFQNSSRFSSIFLCPYLYNIYIMIMNIDIYRTHTLIIV
jgi:hypothetical protein